MKKSKTPRKVNLLDIFYYKREKNFVLLMQIHMTSEFIIFDDLSVYKTYIEKNASSHAHVIVYKMKKMNKYN